MKKFLLLSASVMSLSACDPVTLASVGTHIVKECIFPPPQILPIWWEDYCESQNGVKFDDRPEPPDDKPNDPKPDDPKDPPNDPPDGPDEPGDPEPPDEPTTGKSRSGKADSTNESAPAGDSGWNNPGKGNK